MNEVGWTIIEPTMIQVDNKAAIHMAQDAARDKHTQQISVKERFVTHEVESGTVRVEHITTDENTADHFTKILPKGPFEKHRSTYMGKPNNDQYHKSTLVIK